MRRILIAIARFLVSIGLARRSFHADSGALVHITAQVLDANSAQPLGDVAVSVERPPEHHESQPYRLAVGISGSTGNFDETALIRWSDEVNDIYAQPPDPPSMKVIFEKLGYHVYEIDFLIQTLPVDTAQVAQLMAGQVNLLPQ